MAAVRAQSRWLSFGSPKSADVTAEVRQQLLDVVERRDSRS
jgi:hypothetical protein